ncbi:MAG: hypothetical protein R3B48_23140 [Kofleriaceae bacterium]
MVARGVTGNTCSSETDCSAGLSCQLDESDPDDDGMLGATCAEDRNGHLAGQECARDADCRNGTCALGTCVDLCSIDRDCPPTMVCAGIPRVEARGAEFRGCLPERGVISWDIPVPAPSADVLVPVPTHAVSLSMTMSVNDDSQLVGANFLSSPRNVELFDRLKGYLMNPLRHRPLPIQSVLQIPSTSAVKLEPGAYSLSLSSLRPNNTVGSATPRLRATVRVGANASLRLHFHFVDLQEYPCSAQFDGGLLSAATAAASDSFQGYLTTLRGIFANAGIAISTQTYDDVASAGLDNVTTDNARELLALGKYRNGINVFLVRSISPGGALALGPTPGPIGLRGGGTGVIISLESLCYQDWSHVAHTTAFQLAKFMGLYPNRDLNGTLDPIDDSDDTSDNLMFFSSRGTSRVSPGQRAILGASPALDGSAVQ